MAKRSFLPLLGVLALIQSACVGSIVRTIVESEPAPNFIYIHDQPKVGDFALYTSPDQERIPYMLRVEEVGRERITIAQSWVTPEGKPKFSFSQNMVVDRKGNVLDAYILDTDTGKRVPKPVAAIDGKGFYRNINVRELKKPESFDTPSGRFQATRVVVYEVVIEPGIGKTQVSTLMYIDPNAPFGVVITVQDVSNQLPVRKMLQVIEAYATGGLSTVVRGGTDANSTLLDFIMDAAGVDDPSEFQQHFVLTRYGDA